MNQLHRARSKIIINSFDYALSGERSFKFFCIWFRSLSYFWRNLLAFHLRRKSVKKRSEEEKSDDVRPVSTQEEGEGFFAR